MLRKEASAVFGATLLMMLPLSLVPAAGGAPAAEGVLLVTLREGAGAEDVARRAGALLEQDLSGLGVALLRDAPGLAARLARDPAVLSVEADGTVRAASASWNGAQWNGASWNGASWNGASWNGASWNGASWNGASWNGASWNGASWNGASWNGASWNGEIDESQAPPWGLFAIRAPEAWTTGVPHHNRLVCIVDTGVDAQHPALAPNLAATWNAIAPGAPATDESGHGTHLAGIVAAVHDNAWPVPGVSAARLAAVKALDADGVGRTSDVIEALAWCDGQDAHVVLLAFTEDAPTRAFRAAVADLQRGGALVVASSGNDGCARCVGAPASLPGVLAVGAFGPDGQRAAFSNDGPQVDLLAPGAFITSTYPGGALRTGSGTSQAAAFAAGAAAFLWGKAPAWPAPRVAAALDVGTDEEDRLDLAAALMHAKGAR